MKRAKEMLPQERISCRITLSAASWQEGLEGVGITFAVAVPLYG
jgi:hypothetical protein